MSRSKNNTFTAVAIVMLMFIAGCSVLDKVIYRPDMNQGNYLTGADMAKIHTGMTKSQVVDIIGIPILQDPLGSNTWYYIYFIKSNDKSITTQHIWTLIFNGNDVLSKMDHHLSQR